MPRSVRDILRIDRPLDGDEAIERAHDLMRELSSLLEELFAAAREDGPDDDWEMIFNAIFGSGEGFPRETSIQARTREALALVDRDIPDYDDPDEGYDDDARAWKGAFDEALEGVVAMYRRSTGEDSEYSGPR